MSSVMLIEQLVAIGLSGDLSAAEALPGAGNHAQVLRFSSSLRGNGLAVLEAMPQENLRAFVKALAVYEGTVNGLGSVTALHQILPLVQDEDHSLLDWILTSTESYWYYSHGARSFADLERLKAARAPRRAENERAERDREQVAKSRRAERATERLFNAVRRGDEKAVQALLHQGAAATAATPNGIPLVQYAEDLGRKKIADALRQAQGGVGAG
jgi:hypothetical protein